jgi:hypothetical protein
LLSLVALGYELNPKKIIILSLRDQLLAMVGLWIERKLIYQLVIPSFKRVKIIMGESVWNKAGSLKIKARLFYDLSTSSKAVLSRSIGLQSDIVDT